TADEATHARPACPKKISVSPRRESRKTVGLGQLRQGKTFLQVNRRRSTPAGRNMSMTLRYIDQDSGGQRPAAPRHAWTVFGVLFALMIMDYVDRQVVVSMFPHLKAQWSLSDGRLGALVSIVSITVAIGTLPLSFIADRWSRVK